MPVKINTYACEFRCGYVNTKKARVERHEESCIYNPKVKACATCSNMYTDEMSPDIGLFGERYCCEYECGLDVKDVFGKNIMKYKKNCERHKARGGSDE